MKVRIYSTNVGIDVCIYFITISVLTQHLKVKIEKNDVFRYKPVTKQSLKANLHLKIILK